MIKVLGLARLGRDVELRYTASGDAVATLALAFSYGRRDPQTGNRETTWIEATLWGARAEALAPHLLKGTQLIVSLDDLHAETFQGRNGEGHKLAARVGDLDFAGGSTQQNQSRAGPAPAAPPARGQAHPAPPMAPAPARRPGPPGAGGGSTGFDDMDDDVPY